MEYLIIIYILELENKKFYVGKTKDIKNRLKQHINGKGSVWTKKNKVIKVLKTYEYYVKNEREEEEKENQITIQMMNEKGWNSVRGGWWIMTGELQTIISLKSHGHFANINIENLEFKNREFCIYVLELESGKYYVGYTYELKKAIKKHENGKGSKWTQKYEPKKMVYQETIICNSDMINMNIVDDLVIKYFELKGILNVRGGSFVNIEDEKHLNLIKKKASHNTGLAQLGF